MGKKAFNLTGDQVMAQLTPDEIKGFNLSLPQMTPAAKRFIYLLAQERIQKAALLAACKLAADQAGRAALVQDRSVGIIKATCAIIAKDLKSAIEQAGEGK